MEIHASLRHLPGYKLSNQQEAILRHEQGPLLVIAGPGSGKTLTIILRALNLLLHGEAEPSQIVICTYTEKAAHELQSRFIDMAHKVHYQQDLSELRIDTLHGICSKLIRHYSSLSTLDNHYVTLDEFPQRLFIHKYLSHILSREAQIIFERKWGSNSWETAQQLQDYFDKMMEELIEEDDLLKSGDPFLQSLARAYKNYRKLLLEHNCLSFAAQLRTAHKLLNQPDTRAAITRTTRYVFVDEYQDTNNIQEEIVLALSSATGNLCIVGDDDQALYRFRGATVRNIIEFPQKVLNCTKLYLTMNYRSHVGIIKAYDTWMAQANWSEGERTFRHDKTIQPDPDAAHPDYPAVIAIQGKDAGDEATQFADFVSYLKEQNIITDYNQVALLLYSVKRTYSARYTDELLKHNIPYFCPRARSYFEQEEVMLLMACLATLLRYAGDKQEPLFENGLDEDFATYIGQECLPLLNKRYAADHPLQLQLTHLAQELEQIMQIGDSDLIPSDVRVMDYFYRLLAVEPFATYVRDEKRLYNLTLFSKMLRTFQQLYQHSHLTNAMWEQLQHDLFAIFLRLQQREGLNEHEDKNIPFPSGHVQIMTIHQAKGLEFPIVIVGSLEQGHTRAMKVDRDLSSYYRRQGQNKLFEPERLIPGFDMMRLYYVAFSRAERLLVLTSNTRKRPQPCFNYILHGLPRWPTIKDDLHALKPQVLQEPLRAKRHYSFTADLQIYETCPRQYQFFREYQFEAARPREFLLGQLVHQSIETMHRMILAGKRQELNEQTIQRIINQIYRHLRNQNLYAIEGSLAQMAYEQVYNYFKQNQRELQHIREAELEILIEQGDYILAGRADLLRDNNGQLELVDFKTDSRPAPDVPKLIDYERQLCTYAYALERRYATRPSRLLLYWTSEQRREDAVMEIHYRPEVVTQVQQSFSTIVKRIHHKDFQIQQLPEEGTCRHCDMQHYCQHMGTITFAPSPTTKT